MRDFLARHSYLIVWITALIIIGAVAVLIIQLNGIIPSVPVKYTPSSIQLLSAPPAPLVPQPPSVTIVIQKTKQGNSLVVQWQNLPGGTTAINIFRSAKDKNQWSLWKTISLSADQSTQGEASFSISQTDTDKYSYYVSAVGGGGGNGSSTSPGTTLWFSSSTDPIITTSTTPINPPPSNNPTGTPPQGPSSTNPAPSSSGPTSGGSTPSSTVPSGTPYYNPEIQISGYGTGQSGNFWVQHLDQKIEIGWQNLPQTATTITVSRSQSQDGPWATILTQADPGTTGAYSIQVVDNTVGTPYYYELNALNGSTVIATYGPEYLAGN